MVGPVAVVETVENGTGEVVDHGNEDVTEDTIPSTVFKKQSPNNHVTVFLGSRDLVYEDGDLTPLEGVVTVDQSYLKGRKVFAMLVLTFRYGREDEEVMGLKFYTEAILDFKELPLIEVDSETGAYSTLQRSLARKLGVETYSLNLKISPNSPPSVRLKPARTYNGKPLGVHYDLKVHVADRIDERPHKRSTVRMTVRCIRYAPADVISLRSNPVCDKLSKSFVFSPGRLEIEASLNRETYLHGETVVVRVVIKNNSNKTVHKIKVQLVQLVNVCMFTNGRFKNVVGMDATDDGETVPPNTDFNREFAVKPLSFTKYAVALAIDTGFHDEYNCLASTTGLPPKDKTPYGVSVVYEVKVKVLLSCLDRPLTLRLPFTLCHSHSTVNPREHHPAVPSTSSGLGLKEDVSAITHEEEQPRGLDDIVLHGHHDSP